MAGKRRVLSCSSDFLTPDVSGEKDLSSMRKSAKSTSVIAWFYLLMLTLDKMPDEVWYQVSAPDKKTVFQWYEADCAEYPDAYVPCKRHTFENTWRHTFGEIIKLRKYTRFAKCKVLFDISLSLQL